MRTVKYVSETGGPRVVRCDVTAATAIRIAGSDVPPLRSQIGPLLDRTLPATFLKHADDQTVVTLAAVGQAMQRFGQVGTDFSAWGVVAAPRFLGRATMVGALERFFAEGAWGVSPHIIPHRSLHSVSGTISQALGIHGPNFGVGGGPGCASECLLVAAAMVERERAPGVWLVLSGWDPEPAVAIPTGEPAVAGYCGAVALALRSAQAEWQGMRLNVDPVFPAPATTQVLTLESLLDALADGSPATEACWRLEHGGCAKLEQIGPGAARTVGRRAA